MNIVFEDIENELGAADKAALLVLFTKLQKRVTETIKINQFWVGGYNNKVL